MIILKKRMRADVPETHLDPTSIFYRRKARNGIAELADNQRRKRDTTVELDKGMETSFNTPKWDPVVMDDDDILTDEAIHDSNQKSIDDWFKPDIW